MSAFGNNSGGGQGDRSLTAFVGNLDFQVIQGDLDQFFNGLRVVNVRLIYDNESGQSKGYGYVEFADQESLNAALALSGEEIFGRPVRVDLAVNKGNRNRGGNRGGYNNRGGYQQNRGGYNNYNQGGYNNNYGNQGGYNDRGGYGGGGSYNDRGGYGNDRGGYGGYNDRGGYGNQNALGGGNAFGAPGGGGGYNQQRDYQSIPIPEDPPFVAFVGNLDFSVIQADLDGLFQGMGINEIRIVHDKNTGQSKGYGYVEFATKAALAQALEYHGQEYMGRSLRINVAERKNRQGGFQQNQGGFNDGGGAFGGRNNYNSRGGPGNYNNRGGHRGGYQQNRNPHQHQGSDAFSSRRRQGSGGAPGGGRNFPGGGSNFDRHNSGGSGRFDQGFGGPPVVENQRRVDPNEPILEPTAEDEASRPKLKIKAKSGGSSSAPKEDTRNPSVFGNAKPRDEAAIAKELEREKEREAQKKAALEAAQKQEEDATGGEAESGADPAAAAAPAAVPAQ